MKTILYSRITLARSTPYTISTVKNCSMNFRILTMVKLIIQSDFKHFVDCHRSCGWKGMHKEMWKIENSTNILSSLDEAFRLESKKEIPPTLR
jgi:hypothetical protein